MSIDFVTIDFTLDTDDLDYYYDWLNQKPGQDKTP